MVVNNRCEAVDWEVTDSKVSEAIERRHVLNRLWMPRLRSQCLVQKNALT